MGKKIVTIIVIMCLAIACAGCQRVNEVKDDKSIVLKYVTKEISIPKEPGRYDELRKDYVHIEMLDVFFSNNGIGKVYRLDNQEINSAILYDEWEIIDSEKLSLKYSNDTHYTESIYTALLDVDMTPIVFDYLFQWSATQLYAIVENEDTILGVLLSKDLAEVTDQFDMVSSSIVSCVLNNRQIFIANSDNEVFISGVGNIALQHQIVSLFKDELSEGVYALESDGEKTVVEKIVDDRIGDCFSIDLPSYGLMGAVDVETKELFFANKDGIYDYQANLIFDFQNSGYLLDKVDDFKVDDRKFELLVTTTDQQQLYVSINQEYVNENRQELLLATGYINNSLKLAVAAFNRTNRDYYITIEQLEKITRQDEFFSQMQEKFASGNAPDIISDDAVSDIYDYINNGYISPLSIELDNEIFQQGSINGVKYHNIIYGVPYDCSLKVICYSEMFSHVDVAVKPNTFMELVNDYAPDILVCGMDGTDIICNFFLSDNQNTSYIDWNNSISHLAEKDFIDALEFAKRYADSFHADAPKGIPISDEAEYLKDGRAIGLKVTINHLSDMNYLKACFNGKTSIMGYPMVNGNGAYIDVRSLYGSSLSKYPEGVNEFLSFITSEEIQRKISEWEMPEAGIVGSIPLLSPRHDVIDYTISRQRYIKYETVYSYSNGIKYADTDLSDEQIQDFLYLYNEAKDSKWNVLFISDIIEEELAPFFLGEKTALEVASILDKRIQTYLDEIK